MVFRSLIFDFVFLHETKQGGLSKTGETDVSNPDHACPEWDRTLEWDSKRRPERNEPRVDVFPFEFRHKLCLFHSSSFSLSLFLFPFLFFYSEKRSCGWEMRELAFRDMYWYLFSRRRKYSAFFSLPSPFNSLWIR